MLSFPPSCGKSVTNLDSLCVSGGEEGGELARLCFHGIFWGGWGRLVILSVQLFDYLPPSRTAAATDGVAANHAAAPLHL